MVPMAIIAMTIIVIREVEVAGIDLVSLVINKEMTDIKEETMEEPTGAQDRDLVRVKEETVKDLIPVIVKDIVTATLTNQIIKEMGHTIKLIQTTTVHGV